MARKRVVSRTLKVTQANCMVVCKETAEVSNISISINGEFSDFESAEKFIEKNADDLDFNSKDYKLVCVVGLTVNESTYSMPEAEFIRLAEKNESRLEKLASRKEGGEND